MVTKSIKNILFSFLSILLGLCYFIYQQIQKRERKNPLLFRIFTAIFLVHLAMGIYTFCIPSSLSIHKFEPIAIRTLELPSPIKKRSPPKSAPKASHSAKPSPSMPHKLKPSPTHKNHKINNPEKINAIHDILQKVTNREDKEFSEESFSSEKVIQLDYLQDSTTSDIPESPHFSNDFLAYSYHKKIVDFLRSSLQLPEIGDVRVKISLKSNGRVDTLVILKSYSEKNQEYVKKKLFELTFPISTEDASISSTELVLTLTSD